MAAAAILSFAESGLFGYSNPCMANIYQCTKFDETIFIDDRDKAKKQKYNVGPSDPCMANIYLQSKFGANQSRNC